MNWMKAFAEFRGEVRDILGRHGLYINFADTDDAVLRGIEKVIETEKQAVKTLRSIKEEAWDIFVASLNSENEHAKYGKWAENILEGVRKDRADDELRRTGQVKPTIGKNKI